MIEDTRDILYPIARYIESKFLDINWDKGRSSDRSAFEGPIPNETWLVYIKGGAILHLYTRLSLEPAMLYVRYNDGKDIIIRVSLSDPMMLDKIVQIISGPEDYKDVMFKATRAQPTSRRY